MTTADGAPGTSSVALALGEPVTQRRSRVLLGWVNEQEGVLQLLGRNPTPQDDLAGTVELITAMQTAVRARSTIEVSDPTVPGDRSVLDEVAGRPEVQANFPGADWTVEWVDLTRIVSIQKLILTDGLDSRVAAAVNDSAALVDLCFPTSYPVPLQCVMDPDHLGFTFSSRNPNFRVITLPPHELMVALAPGSLPQKMQGITFGVGQVISYVQVAHYQGRWILRDGYNRAAGLLRAGISIVPAIVVEASSWEFVAPIPGLLDRETALSERPPLLTDFWDDAVSADGLQPAVLPAMRIRAERFVVPR
jgi:hypothetical protein